MLEATSLLADLSLYIEVGDFCYWGAERALCATQLGLRSFWPPRVTGQRGSA